MLKKNNNLSGNVQLKCLYMTHTQLDTENARKTINNIGEVVSCVNRNLLCFFLFVSFSFSIRFYRSVHLL